ncbi:MAG: hypothetical protein ACRC17_05705 [Culicoidibacterales bacterium]
MIDKQEVVWFYECIKCGGEVLNLDAICCEICKACICQECWSKKEVYCFECGHMQRKGEEFTKEGIYTDGVILASKLIKAIQEFGELQARIDVLDEKDKFWLEQKINNDPTFNLLDEIY